MTGTKTALKIFPTLDDRSFERIREIVRRKAGIVLGPEKRALVQCRLQRMAAELGFEDFPAFTDFVLGDASGRRVEEILDLLTTNKTFFFREADQIEFFAEEVAGSRGCGTRAVKVWSAGCSTGEEPISIVLAAAAAAGGIERLRMALLATDLSRRVLAAAKTFTYPREAVESIPERYRRRAFADNGDGTATLVPAFRRPIRFARLNLLGAWPMRGPFDAIFCRNVLIYFSRETQHEIAARFAELLSPGGHLFIGHSENLDAGKLGLRRIRPATYVKS